MSRRKGVSKRVFSALLSATMIASTIPAMSITAGAETTAPADGNVELSRQVAGEGMVLLENRDEALPVQQGTTVAMFGRAMIDYTRGGGGSGATNVDYTRNILQGMQIKEEEGKISLYQPLVDFYTEQVTTNGIKNDAQIDVTDEMMDAAAAGANTAVVTIGRYSSEGSDRSATKGDYYLSDAEEELITRVAAKFDKVIVVLNVGAVTDTSWINAIEGVDAVLVGWQAGMEGGLATADVLVGDVNPSGRLVDTWAKSYEDYPSAETFNESTSYVNYTEDIYVGYRYFETIAQAKEKVNYPFGYGLSYTEFSIEPIWSGEKDGTIYVTAEVTNAGSFPGKEVVQLYYGAPQGLLGKPARVLGAFEKTKELKPGETETLVLTIPTASMASYDDLGKVQKSAYVLEKGDYHFYLGNSVRDAGLLDFVWTLDENQVTLQLMEKMAPSQLPKRLLADGSFEELPQRTPNDFMENGLGWPDHNPEGDAPAVRARARYKLWSETPEKKIMLIDVAEGRASLDEFMAQLTDLELAELLGGQPNTGVANTFGFGNLPEYGVPNFMTADGPAGLRIAPQCGVCTTAWPCSTMLACTWNRSLVEEVGAAAAKEVKENNISFWLTPAVNIHRSPLCGRNFEYYSEDPYLAGEMASAMVLGIQSQKIGATVKHFACNNKETNRKNSDSRVSERAIREIYLKAFEIIVKKADPWAIMSSYNLINGHRASENKDLLTGILRDEWGFNGLVTTDWWTKGEHYKETLAGNDIKMGTGYPERLMEALEKGLITRKDLEVCVERVLKVLMRAE